MRSIIIAPSVLSLDYSKVSKQLQELEESKAQWIHFDVMDGHFVPNLTFGPDILKGFKKAIHKVMDVHLMVSDPRFFSDIFINAGADIITFHLEAMKDIQDCIALAKHIHLQHVKVGLSLKPSTDVEQILPYLEYFDLILVMSVEPGFGGQAFMEDMLVKVERLRQVIDENHYQTYIEIDGGMNQHTAKLAKHAGVDVIVAGSYIFKQDIKKAIESL